MTRRGRDVLDEDDGDPCKDVLEVPGLVTTGNPIAWLQARDSRVPKGELSTISKFLHHLRSGDSSSVMTHELVFVFPPSLSSSFVLSH